jgi:hypothetical protein
VAAVFFAVKNRIDITLEIAVVSLIAFDGRSNWLSGLSAGRRLHRHRSGRLLR